jgi:lycopene beta-cyclase
MEEMGEGFGGMLFKYVLPFSADRVLIEYTVFTQAHIDLDELHRYALNALEREGLGRYEVMRIERAHIPMGLKSQGQHLGVPIGTRAGMARDATGYGFVEMQRWSKLASEALVCEDRALSYRAPRLRSWMDAQLLSLIEHKPAILPELFMTLASVLPADRFASFMMSCEPSDAAAMILSAPKQPFLCAMIGRPQWIS